MGYASSWEVAVGLLLGLLLWVQAATAADLSGRWVLDAAASERVDAALLLMEVPWAKRKIAEYLDNDCTIQQSGDRLTLTFRNMLGTVEQQLVANGQPVQTVNPAGLPTSWVSAWEGESLVSVGVARDESGQEGELIERRALSADGQTLTLQLTVTIDGQSVTIRRVFRRQG